MISPAVGNVGDETNNAEEKETKVTPMNSNPTKKLKNAAYRLYALLQELPHMALAQRGAYSPRHYQVVTFLFLIHAKAPR